MYIGIVVHSNGWCCVCVLYIPAYMCTCIVYIVSCVRTMYVGSTRLCRYTVLVCMCMQTCACAPCPVHNVPSMLLYQFFLAGTYVFYMVCIWYAFISQCALFVGPCGALCTVCGALWGPVYCLWGPVGPCVLFVGPCVLFVGPCDLSVYNTFVKIHPHKTNKTKNECHTCYPLM